MPVELDTIAQVPWTHFKPVFEKIWKQGEHVSLIGPTGCGKSTLSLAIIPRRNFVAILGTKPKDKTLDRLKRQGFVRLQDWSPKSTHNKVLLWPTIRSSADLEKQRDIFKHGLDQMFATGNWCVVVDEARYLTEKLKLKTELEVLWMQGRSVGITVVAGAQRPAFVPTEIYDQASHLFFWRDNDELNLKRIGGIGYTDRKLIASTVASLPRHEALYLNTRSGIMLRTKVTQ
jgi:hypothetical protein